jgi:hypothetical protein
MATDTSVRDGIQEERGRQVLARGLERLRARLSVDLKLVGGRVQRQGDRLVVLLQAEPSRPDVRAAAQDNVRGIAEVTGCGVVRLAGRWLPGDPRPERGIQLALAIAVARLAEASGLGLRICRWR